MPQTEVYTLEPAKGMKSQLVGLFLAQLDDQLKNLSEDTRGATPEELEWQPGPGMNTIGMLLAHIAKVEAGWIGAAALGLDFFKNDAVPVSWADTGMPLAADAAPPEALAGRDLAYFDDLLARARAFTREALAPLSDADLEKRRSRIRRDGTHVDYNVGWALYHSLEHMAGHYGQVNLLRHQYLAARAKV